MSIYYENNQMTRSMGEPVENDNNSITVGPDGPVLLEDVHLIDKMGHFDRERVPERVVHAKGAGAHGVFMAYKCMEKYTMADFLQMPNQKTRVFVRFSTVIGSKGSADTARDPRGFAVKFYTNDGIYDIVGNNMPVFFIRDAMKFPDVIHSLKPSPNDNIRDAQRFWDFISLSPEATHMITWVYSDQGTIKDYTKMDGFGVNTYIWVNAKGQRVYIKYHWKTQQGLETIDRMEAECLAGSDPDVATRKLYRDIENGHFPSWQLCVQILKPEEVETLDFDPLDDTKTWPEDRFPLLPVGMMTLNENPKNFFAETEQAAFCPANIVPGVELSADKMLQGRSFSYVDTQRHRIGPNFAQLPINRSISPVNNNQRDGNMTLIANPEPINYSPNSLNNNKPFAEKIINVAPQRACGYIAPTPIVKQDNFTQAGQHFRSFTQTEKEHLADNMAVELAYCKPDIQRRVLQYANEASKEWAHMVVEAMKKYR